MAGNYVLLETIELTQSAASVTFDNIPQTGYTDLKFVASTRGAQGGVAEANRIRFNGDTTNTNYTGKRLLGSGSAASSDQTTSMIPGFFNNLSSSTANTFSGSEVYIPDYLSSNSKSYSVDTVTENNATEAYMAFVAGRWSGTAAISSITLVPESGNSYVANSTFSLYGVADVNTTPTFGPKATGGNIVYNDGTYWYHQFLTSGTFTAQTPLVCSALVVGGGGGGCVGISGSSYGGGGAGGTAYEYFNKSVAAGTTAVTVGAGGAGSGTNAVAGTAGSTSSVVLDTTYSATGGNPGGTNGVGGSNALYSGGSSDAGGNGGGGAGAGGNGGPANIGGNGTAGTAGAGFSSTILGETIAGGSTGSANGTVPAAVGGGGRGSTDSPNYAGAAPTKFGGGGASVSTAAFRTGFNGTVVIRYAMV